MLNNVAILIDENANTPRLKYLLEWFFVEQLGCAYRIFFDKISWVSDKGFKINYTEKKQVEANLWIKPCGLLAEQDTIRDWNLNIQRWKHTTVLFYNQPGSKVPFDVFSAIFYLMSRYEEYLPFTADKYGRFPEQASVACQYHFLSEPVIDQWVYHFKKVLEQEGQSLPKRQFQCRFTFDVDMAWKYKNRGARRYWGGHARDLAGLNFSGIRERNAVVRGKKEDPYFSFSQIEAALGGARPLFFWLVGDSGKYDRNVSGLHPEMQALIRNLQSKGDMGIHPSYHSHLSPGILNEEIALLSSISKESVFRSRQHFIRFSLPDTYRMLLQSGIREDYSMGYAGHNGFRAGTSFPFYWYDLKKEATTELRIFPFAFMDATSKFYKKQKPEDTYKEWKKMFLKIQAFDGNFISIWHNYILCLGSEWLQIFEQAAFFSKQALQNVQGEPSI